MRNHEHTHSSSLCMNTKAFFVIALVAAMALPTHMASALEVSAWLPYWRSQKSVDSITPQMQQFTEVNPFVYTVKSDGSLNTESPLSNPEWVALRAQAAAQGVRFIPTITWGSGSTIHAILSNEASRRAHVQAITREVYAYNLDGIDIDYEGKLAETNPYFSQFLKELHEAIGYNKWVMCTIESRTPLDSRYSSPDKIPADISYANDFKVLNDNCDRVRIMAYDQGRIDLKLNAANAHPYIPVADVAWVQKVMQLAMQDIAPSKLVIGIPTYGYEYDMFVNSSGNTQYSSLWSFNPGYATDIAQKLGLTPQRNSAGELMLTFPASQSPEAGIPLPTATRVLSWSDAVAIQQKIQLAQTLGLAGVAIFKIDGGQDPNTFNILSGVRGTGTRVALKTPDQQVADSSVFNAPVKTHSTPPARNLQYGDRLEDVRTLQKILNANGFVVAQSGGGSPGNESTFFGPATKAALIKFQKAKGVAPASGYFGPKTRAAMSAL